MALSGAGLARLFAERDLAQANFREEVAEPRVAQAVRSAEQPEPDEPREVKRLW